MYTDKQMKKMQGYAGKSIANMMVGNDKAMVDFLLMVEPTLKREDLEKAVVDGTLWSHEFDPTKKVYDDEMPRAAGSLDEDGDSPC